MLIYKGRMPLRSQESELVIDGRTLTQILDNEEEEALLTALAVRCRAVVVCRASPAQKAAIVLMMKRYHANGPVSRRFCRGGPSNLISAKTYKYTFFVNIAEL